MMDTGHVGINVTDLARSRDFYGAVFHLQPMGGSEAEGRRFAFLGDGSRIVLTLWEQARGAFDRERAGLHHLSFQVPSIDAVREAESALRERGAKLIYDGLVPHAEGTPSGGIFFEDPDGTRLEIFTPAGASEAKAPSDGPSCGFF